MIFIKLTIRRAQAKYSAGCAGSIFGDFHDSKILGWIGKGWEELSLYTGESFFVNALLVVIIEDFASN